MMTHPAAYLPVNIGERVRFEAHGQSFLIGYHSRNTYWLSTDPPGERRRWGDRRQIVEDIEYVLRNGALPPASSRSMWEGRHYHVPPEPPRHFVAPRAQHALVGPGPDGLYTYRGASIELSSVSARHWWATVRFRSQEIDFEARSSDEALEQATNWIDNAPEFQGRHTPAPDDYGRPYPREAVGAHRVADFDTIDDLIAHAAQLGATHVLVAGAHTKLFFPRGGQYPYEEARVWRENRYWHAEGPGARRGVRQLPQDAAPLEGYIDWQRRAGTAEAPRALRPRRPITRRRY